MSSKEGSILVLGLGNPILGDDSFGIKVTEKLREMRLPKDVKVESRCFSPFSAAKRMLNFNKVIIVDSLIISGIKEGTILRKKLEELCSSSHIINPHSLSLPALLEIFKSIYPEKVPEEVIIIGVCISNPRVGEGLSQEIEGKVDEVVKLILRELGGK